jgi:hypothetical protein
MWFAGHGTDVIELPPFELPAYVPELITYSIARIRRAGNVLAAVMMMCDFCHLIMSMAMAR